MKENTTGHWKVEEQAEVFLSQIMQKAYEECPTAQNFADHFHNEITEIDLVPDELDIDFAHNTTIKPLYPYRRARLWCAMHGESMLEAGLNHLE